MAPSLGWTPEAGSAVICVIVVMKMIISYTDNALDPDGKELESVQAQEEAEEKNVLLKYAWHDTSEGVEGTSGIGPSAVLSLQEEVYTDLTNPEGQWARALSEGVTFERLVESPPMLKHFWARPEFRMRVGFEVEQKDGWAPLRRVMNPANDSSPVSLATLAKQSLVRWCSDETELAKRLLRPPIRVDGEEVRFRQVQGWSFGRQECIRVLYDPGTGKNPTGFQDLVGFSITPKTLEIGPQGSRWKEGVELRYQLIAVVRLGPPSYVRVYDKAGKYGVPKALSSQAVSCLNNDWELGQLGSEYMLYYALSRRTDPSAESAEEMSPTASKRWDVNTADALQPSLGLVGFSSLPAPAAPAEPKAQRDRAAGAFESQRSSLGSRVIRSPPPAHAPTGPRAHRDLAAAQAPANGRRPRLSGTNTIPVRQRRDRRFGDQSPARPSGQHGGSEEGTRDPPAPANKKAVEPRRSDPRPRSDDPDPFEGSRTPFMDPAQPLRRPVGDPAGDEDIWGPRRKTKPSAQGHPVPHPGNTESQPQGRRDPRRRADEPGGPDSARPDMWYAEALPNHPRQKRRRLEEDEL